MAISFSRPDPSSPAAVGAASFPVSKRGFDQGEVRDFLRMVAAERARLQERERFLESEMRALQTRGMSSPGRLDEETVTTLLGEEAARVLSTARDASSQIRDRAEESATRLVKDAAEDAARIREAAILEAQRIRDDAASDAEAEIEMAKQQGRDMVNEAREYREKVLSELSRRRDAARSQIEQLLHGRDRLLSAFERARLATDDVIGGLTEAHDEPEFIVNLAPVTGPIPVINPDHPSLGLPEEVENREKNAVVIFDDAQVPEDDIQIEHATVEDTIVEDTIVEDANKTVIEDTNNTVVEDRINTVVNNTVVEDASITDNTVTEPEAVEEPTLEEEPSHEVSNVVSLFGRERVTPVLPEVQSESPAPVETRKVASVKQDPTLAHKADDTRVAGDTSHKVDDIFARLRADSSSAVANAATQSIAKESITKEKTAEKAPVKEKQQRAKKIVDPKVFEERNELLAPLVPRFSRKLKRVLADEQNNVLEHLRKKRSVLEIDAILGSIDEHAMRYSAAISDEAMKAGAEGAKSMKPHGGSSRRVIKKDLDTVIQKALTESLLAKFREDTRIAIGEAEGDREILAGLMRDVYRQWKMSSLDEHVDDVVYAAYDCGAYLSLEPQTALMWVVEPTNGCCSDCSDNSLADSVEKGKEFPTGHLHPLAHTGCRCLVLPISH